MISSSQLYLNRTSQARTGAHKQVLETGLQVASLHCQKRIFLWPRGQVYYLTSKHPSPEACILIIQLLVG